MPRLVGSGSDNMRILAANLQSSAQMTYFDPSMGTLQTADVQFRAWGASENLLVVGMFETTIENANKWVSSRSTTQERN